MTDNRKFTAAVDDFVKLTKDKMLRVAKQSIQDIVLDAQTPVSKGGNMPVDTGFLRNSIVSSIEGSGEQQGNDAAVFTIAAMDLGDIVSFAWTAEYAIPRHYMVGVGQGGGLWRDAAASKWEATVRRNALRVK